MMIGRMRKFMQGKKGQGMTEYIIIVALIAIAAIVIYAAFGQQIQAVVRDIGLSLSGEAGDADVFDAEVRESDMGTFDDDSDI